MPSAQFPDQSEALEFAPGVRKIVHDVGQLSSQFHKEMIFIPCAEVLGLTDVIYDRCLDLSVGDTASRQSGNSGADPTLAGASYRIIVSYHDFAYQAQSWHLPRRVVAKVEWHQGELFPRVGFIVTNLSYPPKGIVRFYNGRGTAEQWIKEGKYALNWTRLSCHKFVANQVRLWLFVLTYNLGNFMRRLVLPEDMKHWTLTSLQTRLIKTGGRLVPIELSPGGRDVASFLKEQVCDFLTTEKKQHKTCYL